MNDQVDRIIAYEQGELNDKGIVKLFSELVQSGAAWSLQGSYGRTAMSLIENSIIDKEGNIVDDRFADFEWFDGGEGK